MTTVSVMLRVPQDLATALKRYAGITGKSQNSVVTDALVEYLRVHGADEMVRAAFEKVLKEHQEALQRLENL